MSEERTIVLGDEYDDRVRTALKESLRSLGAIGMGSDWGLVGSQEVDRWEVLVGDKVLVIEAETYIGLSLTGDVELTTLVEALVKTRIQELVV
jgi:hypothetical protein